MFNLTPGYYNVNIGIEVDRYYVLCLKNLRKPKLLRFSCKSAFMAKRYIILKPQPELYEVIKGYDALERNIPLSTKRLNRSEFPEKYCYPLDCTTPGKKKQHRTNYRDDIRRAIKTINKLKQYTITYRSRIYSIFQYSLDSAFRHINKACGITWKYFISNYTTNLIPLTKNTVFIKTKDVNLVMINQFVKNKGGKTINKAPVVGKLTHLEKMYLKVNKPKPKKLYF